MEKIKVENLSISFGDITILDALSFSIEEKERVAIIGPSGAGKTTLLRILSGLEKNYTGSVTVFNKKTIAMIFQDGLLFNHIKVKDNIAIGLKKLGYSKDLIQKEVQDIALKLHISDLLERYPSTLSSGQKQRVGIARALVRKPDILLLDEPFSNLDVALKEEFKKEIINMQRKMQFTMITVTHDIDEAFYFGEKIGILQNSKLLAFDFSNVLVQTPQNLKVLLFLFPDSNILEGEILHNALWLQGIKICSISALDQKVYISIQKDAIVLHSGKLQGYIGNISILKNGYEYELKFQNTVLHVFSKELLQKQNICFSFTDTIHVFKKDGTLLR